MGSAARLRNTTLESKKRKRDAVEPSSRAGYGRRRGCARIRAQIRAETEPEDSANGFLHGPAASAGTTPEWEPASARADTKPSWRRPLLRPEAQTSTSALQSGRTSAGTQCRY